MTTRFGTFGLPPDVAGWAAVALAVALVVFHRRVERLSTRTWLGGAALVAAAASWAYVVGYLGGAPRLIDATSYFLEARTFAAGRFTIDVEGALPSTAGRFLVPDPSGERLGVIFPPGYPLALAPWVLVDAPMVLGPAIAAGLVLATYHLTKNLFDDVHVAVLAASLGAVCACLRYHTADTMSHGWAALMGTLALLGATRNTDAWTLASGLCLGWLACTRPVSAAPIVVGLAMVRWWRGGTSARWATLVALGALPGVALLIVHAHALTGTWFGSPQLRYYALSDGPPGCFRYGFGADVGCRHEHASFVAQYMPNGFGPLEALATTARRLALHARDAGNSALFGLALLVALWMGRNHRAIRCAGAVIVGQVVAYAPFYFDGNVPGAGARMYADVLPLEHAAIAWLLQHRGWRRWALPSALLGFASSGAFDHRHLSNREGGAPMFDARAARELGSDALLFMDTDHGFNLAFDPGGGASPAVARLRRDGNDRIAWLRHGQPPSFRVEFDPFGELSRPTTFPYDPATLPWRFEGEANWPVVGAVGGWAHPGPGPACSSRGQALRLVATQTGARFTLRVTPPHGGSYVPHLGWTGALPNEIAWESSGVVAPVSRRSSGEGCWLDELPIHPLEPDGELLEITVTSSDFPTALDFVFLGNSPEVTPR